MTPRETKRQELLELFKRKEPIWKDEDHPELKDGAAAWVRKTREADEARFQRIQKLRERK
jgi:molybdopterin synthase catalytic subunit